MTVELRTHAARDRAEAERERIERKRAAFEAFGRRVRSVSADGGARSRLGGAGSRPATSMSGGRSPGGALAAVTAASANTAGGADSAREAFGETVLPHADADAVQRAMAEELSPDLAAALSPAGGGFGPGLKAQLTSRVGERVAECRLLADAVEAEADRLREAAERLDTVTAWLAEADETPLLQLGFEELRDRHDRLAAFRETCDELARERQTAVRETNRDGTTGVRTREVLDLLYADFAADHPVLADLAKLDSVLADCQRSVRRHLCARV